MALLSTFINIADRIGLPVKMLRYVQARFDIGTTTGGSLTYAGAANKLRLNKEKMEALTSATIGGIDVDGELEFDDEHEAVADLYHEATHAYTKLKLAEADKVPDPASANESQQAALRVRVVMADATMHYVKNAPEAYFTNLLDPNQLSARAFGGVPIPHRAPAIQERAKKKESIGSSPLEQAILARGRQMASEAAAMYVAHRASSYWYTYDWLVFDRNSLKKKIGSGDYVREPLNSYGIDKINTEIQALFRQQARLYRRHEEPCTRLLPDQFQLLPDPKDPPAQTRAPGDTGELERALRRHTRAQSSRPLFCLPFVRETVRGNRPHD